MTDTGEAPAASSATSGTQVVSRLQTTQTQISWQADDPDNDKLVYSVYFRAEDGDEWQMIRSRMFENTLLLDPDVFADGRYFFRVVASDAPSNAPEFAHQAELVSAPVLIDNTPPVVTVASQKRDGMQADVEIDARDKTSPHTSMRILARCRQLAADRIDRRHHGFAGRTLSYSPGKASPGRASGCVSRLRHGWAMQA